MLIFAGIGSIEGAVVEFDFELSEEELGSPGSVLARHSFERRGYLSSCCGFLALSIDLHVESQK